MENRRMTVVWSEKRRELKLKNVVFQRKCKFEEREKDTHDQRK